jgi:8-oxo-dGTP pyrophosphatase MutT (NUDIX family)
MSLRPAATVVVARSGRTAAGRPSEADGLPEVLVLTRSASSRFAPGFVVFPGGAVEAHDRALARRWFGAEAEVARACALRELAEETGLVLTANGLVEAGGRLPGGPGLPLPSVDELPEMARWIAPEFLPVRFDARFFAVAAPRGLQARPDGHEVVEARWAVPSDLLRDQANGEISLMWPTLKTLEALAGCASVRDVVRLRVTQVPPPATAPSRW